MSGPVLVSHCMFGQISVLLVDFKCVMFRQDCYVLLEHIGGDFGEPKACHYDMYPAVLLFLMSFKGTCIWISVKTRNPRFQI